MSSHGMRFPFSAPLNQEDSPTQTLGCRQNNPDICANNMLPDICAFARKDGICMKPSRAWKKKYEELKETPHE